MPSSFRKMHKLGGDHLPTSTVTVWRSAAINLLWVPIISFNLLWRSVVPRGRNFTYNGDPRVGKLTFENLKMSNFPWIAPPPPSWGKPLIGALKMNISNTASLCIQYPLSHYPKCWRLFIVDFIHHWNFHPFLALRYIVIDHRMQPLYPHFSVWCGLTCGRSNRYFI